MWDESQNEITPELGSQERLLWSGRPRSGILFRPADAFLIPFSLMWGGFAIFWEAIVLNSNAPFFFKLWGIPFVLIGLYLIFGRFIVEATQRDKIHYGVTSERIIIVSGFYFRSVKSLNIETLTDISLTEKSDQTGTITFGPIHPFFGIFGGFAGSNWPGAAQFAPPSLELVPDARKVYEIIREAQRESRKHN